jgi:hypothetical protein
VCPADLQIQIGSQWWCLRRRTVEGVLAFLDRRPDVMRFFRTTWIPDETFFQTLVRHLVPDEEIRTRTLTFLMFTDYGMPVTFYNDHYDLLTTQDYLFARKISPDATALKQRLGALYAARGVPFQISNEGRSLFQFLTGRGRIGRRFAPRFWEREASLGRERTLLMVICKKWHVAKRLVAAIGAETGWPALEYLFNEATCPAARSGRHPVDAGKAHPPPPRPGADAVRLLENRPPRAVHRPGQCRPDADFCSDAPMCGCSKSTASSPTTT